MNYYYPFPPLYNYGGYPYQSGGPAYPQYQQNPAEADESSYIENILRLNLGKIVSIYMKVLLI